MDIVIIAAFVLLGIVMAIRMPIMIARNRGVSGNQLMTVKILSWFGIFIGITWFIALFFSFFFKPAPGADIKGGGVTAIVIVYCLGAVISIPLMLSSFFIFDSPGSEDNPLTQVLFYSVWASVPLYALAIELGKKSRKFYLLGLICPVVFITSLILLDVFCDGEFSCRKSNKVPSPRASVLQDRPPVSGIVRFKNGTHRLETVPFQEA